MVIPKAINGTILSAKEFHNNLCLRYGITLEFLPTTCNGCNKTFLVSHALNCRKGGLISLCHSEIADKWAHLCSVALGHESVVHEPTIFLETHYNPQNTSPPPFDHIPTSTLTAEANACSDKGVIGFWHHYHLTVFDAQIVTPIALLCIKRSPKHP